MKTDVTPDKIADYITQIWANCSLDEAQDYALDLLPLVNRLCAEAAAKALNDAADDYSLPMTMAAANRLRDRAAALTDVDGVQL